MGRPKAGSSRKSEHTRLSKDTKHKLKIIAEHHGVPIADVVDRFMGKRIDREYRAIVNRELYELGGEG